MVGEALQRLRITFAKGNELKFIGHLDTVRLWERAFRRAKVPLAYAHRFNPQPRLAFASPLPLGFTSRGEVLDIFLEGLVAPLALAKALAGQLPPGIEILAIEEVGPALPALQAEVASAEYLVGVRSAQSGQKVASAIQGLLASGELPIRREREGQAREVDLRPLIYELRLEESTGDGHILAMHLETGQRGHARPEEVLRLLGLEEGARLIERVRLHFAPRTKSG